MIIVKIYAIINKREVRMKKRRGNVIRYETIGICIKALMYALLIILIIKLLVGIWIMTKSQNNFMVRKQLRLTMIFLPPVFSQNLLGYLFTKKIDIYLKTVFIIAYMAQIVRIGILFCICHSISKCFDRVLNNETPFYLGSEKMFFNVAVLVVCYWIVPFLIKYLSFFISGYIKGYVYVDIGNNHLIFIFIMIMLLGFLFKTQEFGKFLQNESDETL